MPVTHGVAGSSPVRTAGKEKIKRFSPFLFLKIQITFFNLHDILNFSIKNSSTKYFLIFFFDRRYIFHNLLQIIHKISQTLILDFLF